MDIVAKVRTLGFILTGSGKQMKHFHRGSDMVKLQFLKSLWYQLGGNGRGGTPWIQGHQSESLSVARWEMLVA